MRPGLPLAYADARERPEGVAGVGKFDPAYPTSARHPQIALAAVRLTPLSTVESATAPTISGSRSSRRCRDCCLERFVGVMTETRKGELRLRKVECPNCRMQFLFRRARVPRFDAHGFESYLFDCKSCRVLLTGVVHPYHGTLLVQRTVPDFRPIKEETTVTE
jgi:hypothetical protein